MHPTACLYKPRFLVFVSLRSTMPRRVRRHVLRQRLQGAEDTAQARPQERIRPREDQRGRPGSSQDGLQMHAVLETLPAKQDREGRGAPEDRQGVSGQLPEDPVRGERQGKASEGTERETERLAEALLRRTLPSLLPR